MKTVEQRIIEISIELAAVESGIERAIDYINILVSPIEINVSQVNIGCEATIVQRLAAFIFSQLDAEYAKYFKIIHDDFYSQINVQLVEDELVCYFVYLISPEVFQLKLQDSDFWEQLKQDQQITHLSRVVLAQIPFN